MSDTKTEFVYSINEEDFTHDCVEDALDALDGRDALWVDAVIWRGIGVKKDASAYFDLDRLLEDMGERAYDESSEWAQDFPDVSADQKKELESIVAQWLDKNVTVNFWSVKDVQPITVTQEMIDQFRRPTGAAA